LPLEESNRIELSFFLIILKSNGLAVYVKDIADKAIGNEEPAKGSIGNIPSFGISNLDWLISVILK
jgi:hypothetical protein